MYYLKETTDWKFPNHTYIFKKKGASKAIGYIKEGETVPTYFVSPLSFSKTRRKFVEV